MTMKATVTVFSVGKQVPERLDSSCTKRFTHDCRFLPVSHRLVVHLSNSFLLMFLVHIRRGAFVHTTFSSFALSTETHLTQTYVSFLLHMMTVFIKWNAANAAQITWRVREKALRHIPSQKSCVHPTHSVISKGTTPGMNECNLNPNSITIEGTRPAHRAPCLSGRDHLDLSFWHWAYNRSAIAKSQVACCLAVLSIPECVEGSVTVPFFIQLKLTSAVKLHYHYSSLCQLLP